MVEAVKSDVRLVHGRYAGFRFVELSVTRWPGLDTKAGMHLLSSGRLNMTAHFAHSDVARLLHDRGATR